MYSDSGFGTGIVRAYTDAANTIPEEAWLIQGEQNNTKGIRNSFYVGDTISAGRLVVNAGLRYDIQTSVMTGGFKAGNPALPALFPDLTEAPFDPGFGWNSLSPRLGLTYDLSGTGRTVLRLSLARYGSQMNAGEFELNQTLGYREADLAWSDLNGNDRVDAGETGELLWQSSGWDPSDPTAPPQNTFDEYGNPWSDELILGVEHELNRSLAIGVDFTYKKNSRFNWGPRIGDIAADGNWIQEPNPQCSGGITAGCSYFSRENAVSPWTHTAERLDYKTEYKGATFSLTKRFANKWMGNFSFVYANPTRSFGRTPRVRGTWLPEILGSGL